MIIEFKRLLEKKVRIYEWDPSKEQLLVIAQFIQSQENDLNDLSAFICDTCKNVTLMFFEGQDNSDLNTLFALAKAVVNESE